MALQNLLSILIWLPIAAGLLVLALGDARIAFGRWVALAATVATLAIAVPLWTQFDTGTAALQFTERLPWIARFNAWYALGVDGISMPLIVLTALMTVPVVIAGWTVIKARPAQYYAAFLVMEGLMIGSSTTFSTFLPNMYTFSFNFLRLSSYCLAFMSLLIRSSCAPCPWIIFA